MTTFADKILNELCDHEWRLVSTNWMGRSYECIYCQAQDYQKNEVRSINC